MKLPWSMSPAEKPLGRSWDPEISSGEGRPAGQSIRIATAFAPTTVLRIGGKKMIRVLHEEHDFSDRFIAYMLTRNVRVEEDLIDQLFNSSEKRMARTLLMLARYGSSGDLHKTLQGCG